MNRSKRGKRTGPTSLLTESSTLEMSSRGSDTFCVSTGRKRESTNSPEPLLRTVTEEFRASTTARNSRISVAICPTSSANVLICMTMSRPGFTPYRSKVRPTIDWNDRTGHADSRPLTTGSIGVRAAMTWEERPGNSNPNPRPIRDFVQSCHPLLDRRVMQAVRGFYGGQRVNCQVLANKEGVEPVPLRTNQPVALLDTQAAQSGERGAVVQAALFPREVRIVGNRDGIVGAPGIVELSHDDSRSRAIERLPDPVIDAVGVYVKASVPHS